MQHNIMSIPRQHVSIGKTSATYLTRKSASLQYDLLVRFRGQEETVRVLEVQAGAHKSWECEREVHPHHHCTHACNGKVKNRFNRKS